MKARYCEKIACIRNEDPYLMKKNELRSFATVHYSLVATSAMFAELKQFKAIFPGNRHTNTQTDRLINPHYAPTQNEVK